MRFSLRVACFSVLVAFWSVASVAQDYPNKVIKLVIPYPPGGVVDITGRLLAEQLGPKLGGTVIVENKPGAGGTIGAGQVAHAPADGYTILLSGAATQAMAPWLYKQLPYDPAKDFVPVTQVTEGPLALCVNSDSKLKSLPEFLAALKANGSSMNYASNGNGTYPHLSVALMSQVTGTTPMHIPYPGGAQAITALIANEVQFTQNHIPVVQAHVKSGRLRVLATTGAKRSATYPDVPTLQEAGVPVVASAWFGLFVPAGTPPAIVERLHAATVAATQSPALRDRLAAQGDEVVVEGPAKFQAFQAAELAKWKKVISDARITMQ
ncbi:MAG: tripartite tricarboxylate transporter substrate binding protein [Gammaproteobacteria bacterium]|nr:tripartite tricarboxylate transporter substrate binding protein [Gammaproteobacteria bacterium]